MSDNKFHDHLDVCKQCEKHPFDLCPIGAAALQKEASKHIHDPLRYMPDHVKADVEKWGRKP